MPANSLTHALDIRRGDTVAIVGAGGKTTLMYRLAAELAECSLRTLLTTTTKFAMPAPGAADVCVTAVDDEAGTRKAIARAFQAHRRVALAGRALREDKVEGPPLEWLAHWHRDGIADVMLIEADGARRHAIKGHKEDEPVVPACSTKVIGIAPLDALGRLLDESLAHRLEILCRIHGCRPGDPVTPALLAGLMAHPDGYRRANPPGAAWIPFFNRLDTVPERSCPPALAQALRQCMPAVFRRAVCGSALHRDCPVDIIA